VFRGGHTTRAATHSAAALTMLRGRAVAEHRCSYDGLMARLRMIDINAAAATVNALCTTRRPSGASARYALRCTRCRYQWRASYESLSRGHGCPQCANRVPRVPNLASSDITGMSFGRWSVVGPGSYRYWLCRCVCGTLKAVRKGSLVNGSSRSCGCGRSKDLAGRTFGQWVVLTRAEPTANASEQVTWWLCRCSCGTLRVVRGNTLTGAGRSQSCGCRYRDLEPGESGLRRLIQAYKRRARARRLAWKLTEQQVRALTTAPCAYCGAPPSRYAFGTSHVSARARGYGKYLCNGIDRLDNSKGYAAGNVVPSCEICNRAKRDLPVRAFIAYRSRMALAHSSRPAPPCAASFPAR
jgi:hypothetical protein